MSTFLKKSNYNNETKNQLWLSSVGDTHDMFCGCDQPFAHILDCIFPPGHIDRHKTVDSIIKRDRQQCHSGGEDEEDHGIPLGGSAATERKEPEDIKEEEDVDHLFAAAAACVEELAR